MPGALESFSKWVQLKIYQLEVTYSVYMFTPMEKFIFYSFLFLLCGLTFIACILYLPHHIQFIISRAWFYIHGEEGYEFAKGTLGQLLSSTTTAAAKVTVDAAREL
ncbi:hypothetical protein VTJ04DRAFT_8022 [Mycothermus thermophilus]|uniref:uncharacterized protein n=1 Tax=Humicola insolens TaxID=85995 RepID=UPI0037437DF3